MQTVTCQTIGVVHSPFKQKFAIPRQPGLVGEAHGYIELTPEYASVEAVRGLAQFSHLWLIFAFHQTAEKGWSPLVRPPRLGGNTRMGVFATRATHRPNPLGLSVVKLERVECKGQRIRIFISGLDLLDNTPILDIKPYLPYSDSHPEALGGFADARPQTDMQVSFSESALAQVAEFEARYPDLQALIVKLLRQDPRPAYKKKRDAIQHYGVELYDLDIRWQVDGQLSTVTEIKRLTHAV